MMQWERRGSGNTDLCSFGWSHGRMQRGDPRSSETQRTMIPCKEVQDHNGWGPPPPTKDIQYQGPQTNQHLFQGPAEELKRVQWPKNSPKTKQQQHHTKKTTTKPTTSAKGKNWQNSLGLRNEDPSVLWEYKPTRLYISMNIIWIMLLVSQVHPHAEFVTSYT